MCVLASESHALTLNPYLGLDTLRPFVERAGKYGRGLFILARTSNPGSADYQEKVLDGGDPLYQVVAKSLSPICDEMVGPSTGWSSVGIVAGAEGGTAGLARQGSPGPRPVG